MVWHNSMRSEYKTRKTEMVPAFKKLTFYWKSQRPIKYFSKLHIWITA